MQKKYFFVFVPIIISSILGSILVFFRIYRTGYATFYFLLWNLFLAWIPLVFSTIAESQFNKKRYIVFYLFSVFWLLFYPNAPYIITDLIHLKISKLMPIWFDAILILSFAWTGLFISYISLRTMHGIINKLTNQYLGWIFVVVVTSLSSFGIYLGRFLRWNSWDVVNQPKELIYSAVAPIINPLDNKWPWLFTVLFFITSLYIYLTFYITGYIQKYWSEDSKIK